MLLDQPIVERVKLLLRFTGLARRHDVDLWIEACLGEILHDRRRIQVVNVAIGDEEDTRRYLQVREIPAQSSYPAPIDDGIVAFLPHPYVSYNRGYTIKFTRANQHSNYLLSNLFSAPLSG